MVLLRFRRLGKDGLDDCSIDLWDMYRDYINGEKEIAEINAEFQAIYYAE